MEVSVSLAHEIPKLKTAQAPFNWRLEEKMATYDIVSFY
jgi:hypothetical protein